MSSFLGGAMTQKDYLLFQDSIFIINVDCYFYYFNSYS